MTRTKGKHVSTTTIQIWPGGKSVEYRGEIDGPANQRSLRAGHYSARIACRGADSCERITRSYRGDTPGAWGAYFSDGDLGYLTVPDDDPRIGNYCIAVVTGTGRDQHAELTICPACKGTGFADNPVKNPWRKGTADEWRAVRIEVRAELYGSRDVLGCDSALVDDLIKAANGGELRNDGRDGLREGFDYDSNIRNIYRDCSEFDAAQCREYASDEGIDLPDLPTIDCQECDGTGEIEVVGGSDPCLKCGGVARPSYKEGTGQVLDPDADEDDSRHGWLTEAREACQEHAQENPAEVYEWWRVSSWLCEQLHAIGEVTIDNNYGYWWGRTCTGQGWIMDGTLQQVAARYERDAAEDARKIAAVAHVVSGKGEQA